MILAKKQGFSTNLEHTFYAKQSQIFQKFKLKIKDLQLFRKVGAGLFKNLISGICQQMTGRIPL